MTPENDFSFKFLQKTRFLDDFLVKIFEKIFFIEKSDLKIRKSLILAKNEYYHRFQLDFLRLETYLFGIFSCLKRILAAREVKRDTL